MPQRPDTQSSKQTQRAQNWSLFLKQGFGCLLAPCVAVAGFLAGALVASLLVYVLQQAIPIVSWSTIAVLPVIALGFGGLLAANPVLRRLCYRLKRRHLQRHGITIEATVAHQEWISIANARGPSGDRFDLTLRWQHPETDQVYEYVCMYIFPFGLSRKERQQFFNDYRSGAHLPVLFSPKHPGYFVVDIPFVPIWFDVLF